MKRHIIFAAFLLGLSVFTTSCNNDLGVEPEKSIEVKDSEETEYQLQLTLQTNYSLQDAGLEQSGHIIMLDCQSTGSSLTFSDVTSTSELYYNMDEGRIYGTVHVSMPNTEETLMLRIEEKNDYRSWEELEQSCHEAVSYRQFAGMNFNGQICLSDMPSSMFAADSDATFTIDIKGSLSY